MILALITLISALWLSITAAYFSVYGLTALFPGAFWSIILMGGGIEFAKIVAAAWIHNNWYNKRVKPVMKYYLVFGIMTMMLLTSTGIFGYLSQSHLETTVSSDSTSLQVEKVQNKIASEQSKLDAANKELGLLDKSLDVYLNNDKVTTGLKARKSQEAERKQLSDTINEARKNIDELNTEIIPLKEQASQNSVKLGPIKYVAELLFKDYQSNMDTAVRVVIMLIIFVFDPMAILLILASGISFTDYMDKKKGLIPDDQPSTFLVASKTEASTQETKIEEPKRPEVNKDAPFVPNEEYRSEPIKKALESAVKGVYSKARSWGYGAPKVEHTEPTQTKE